MSTVHTSAARTSAIDQLSRIDPAKYARSRNNLDGAVTRLSAFLRHGVLSLAEVRDAVETMAGGAFCGGKLIQELAWRDYYQRIWRLLRDDIWSDLEPYKTGFDDCDYSDELPDDLLSALTGIDYIDHFVNELHVTGYLHNHARMWLAAYVVHGRRVKWQAGARWFLSHLLDGDEASNNLSWQWCASTFSHKPYIFNRENVLKFSGDQFASHQKNDPFDADYETLSRRFFRDGFDSTQPQRRFDLRVKPEFREPVATNDPAIALVWVHDGMMSPSHPAVALGRAHLFVWDDQHIADYHFSSGRIAFQLSALFCPDIHSQGRAISEVILESAKGGEFKTIVTGETADPRLLRTIDQLKAEIDVRVIAAEPFVELTGEVDLTRFSRYWAKAQQASQHRREVQPNHHG